MMEQQLLVLQQELQRSIHGCTTALAAVLEQKQVPAPDAKS
jgi:hypothetical protein